ncbi:MAG: hypothetical protein ACLQNE_40945 [Thermoguttaceae bacterium]
MKTKLFLVLISAVWLLVSDVPVRGQDQYPIQTVKLVLRAASVPRQALEYQLLPPIVDRRPGNAAVEYNRLAAERAATFGSSEFWNRVKKWQEAPLGELRQPEVRKAFSDLESLLQDLDRAARCDYCDWQILNRVREQEFYKVLLPEFQQSRSYARILSPWVRMKVAEGKFDEAVRGLQTGFALGRDVANAPFVVCGYIGFSIANMMSFQVFELIQQPGAPNLYWALSDLPRPIADSRASYRGAMDLLYLSYPELRDLDKKHFPPEHWRYLLHRSQDQFFGLMEDWSYGDWPEDSRRKLLPAEKEIIAAVYLLNAYPKAKRFLIERGKPAAEVEAMPVPQVILVAGMQGYNELRDNVFKWALLADAEARQGIQRAEVEMSGMAARGEEIIPLGLLLFPSFSGLKHAEIRTERGIAFLRTIEALRLYAAGHGHRLPENLKDITEVPVPIDPFHGEPFVYHREGLVGVLEAHVTLADPIQSGPLQYWQRGVRMEITIAEEGK